MNRLSVLHFPDPRLRQPARPVEHFGTPALRERIEAMIHLMRKQHGIGLAATQVGLPLQLAVIELKDGPLTIINPHLDVLAAETDDDEEGCLSVPRVYGTVPRAKRLRLRAVDVSGTPFEVNAAGLFARVIQHEYDHLQGALFLDRCTQITSGLEEARRLNLHISPLS